MPLPAMSWPRSGGKEMTNAISGARLLPGWLPVFGPETLAELEPLFRERIVRRHIRAASGSWIPPPSISIPGSGVGRGTFCCPAPSCGARPASAATARSVPRPWWTAAGVGDGVTVNASQVSEQHPGRRLRRWTLRPCSPRLPGGPQMSCGRLCPAENCRLGEEPR